MCCSLLLMSLLYHRRRLLCRLTILLLLTHAKLTKLFEHISYHVFVESVRHIQIERIPSPHAGRCQEKIHLALELRHSQQFRGKLRSSFRGLILIFLLNNILLSSVSGFACTMTYKHRSTRFCGAYIKFHTASCRAQIQICWWRNTKDQNCIITSV